jgi:glycosyltransferase involved in cell wall biosynthesis
MTNASQVPQILAHHDVVLGVPVFNEARFLEQTLNSIAAQDHADFAVVVSDNSSTDSTQEICLKFVERDPRFRFVRHSRNIGAAANFEFVFQATSSPFFAWIGGHDVLHPSYLGRHLEHLRSNGKLGNSYTFFRFIDAQGQIVRWGCSEGIHPPRGRVAAYLLSIAVGWELGPIHGVFRRTAMAGIRFPSCFAADHALLSRAVVAAPMERIPGFLYSLRDFDESSRSQNVLERLSGREGDKPDMSHTIDCFLEDFDQMAAEGSLPSSIRPIVVALLRDRYRNRLKLSKLVRSVLKRVRRRRSGPQSFPQEDDRCR